jgi:hypothetical protein
MSCLVINDKYEPIGKPFEFEKDAYELYKIIMNYIKL